MGGVHCHWFGARACCSCATWSVPFLACKSSSTRNAPCSRTYQTHQTQQTYRNICISVFPYPAPALPYPTLPYSLPPIPSTTKHYQTLPCTNYTYTYTALYRTVPWGRGRDRVVCSGRNHALQIDAIHTIHIHTVHTIESIDSIDTVETVETVDTGVTRTGTSSLKV